MRSEYLVGNKYLPNNGEGLTVQDLVDMLMTIPRKSRLTSYVQVVFAEQVAEILGMGIAQSDQAQAHELKVYLESGKP